MLPSLEDQTEEERGNHMLLDKHGGFLAICSHLF